MPPTAPPVAFINATTPPARKDDSGKLDMTLLDEMPRAVKALGEVMQWAITKKAPIPDDLMVRQFPHNVVKTAAQAA